ncbi:MAG: GTPase Era [Bacillota bacterium]|uniref:GTPase Era n=1 Tax=Desulforudis sp. DRI-14 TaxID=3459793 RepID=UPI0034805DA5
MTEGFRSGFVTIIGRPNVGKSTLLNAIMGRKVAIISPKPQTTRHRIRSVLTRDDAQIIFVDTPGIHKPRHRLGEYMVDAALQTLKDVDLILFVTEVDKDSGSGDGFIIKQLEGLKTPVFLVLNKIDKIPRLKILPVIDRMKEKFPFAEIFPVSAARGENLDRLVDTVVKYLPEGLRYYPDDTVTDQPEQVIMAELVREKILHLTSQEIPHSVAVVIEDVQPRPKNVTLVRATIYVERDSQKAILIGEGGQMLKRIGEDARKEIEGLVGMKVFLELWVKVKENWRDDERYLQEYLAPRR